MTHPQTILKDGDADCRGVLLRLDRIEAFLSCRGMLAFSNPDRIALLHRLSAAIEQCQTHVRQIGANPSPPMRSSRDGRYWTRPSAAEKGAIQ